jgi:rubrerythrin
MAETREATTREVIRVLQQNWRAEKESARVYRELAEAEKDKGRKDILLRLADAEEHHAARWEKRLAELGANVPTLSDDLKRRFNRWFNRHAGTAVAIRRLEAA